MALSQASRGTRRGIFPFSMTFLFWRVLTTATTLKHFSLSIPIPDLSFTGYRYRDRRRRPRSQSSVKALGVISCGRRSPMKGRPNCTNRLASTSFTMSATVPSVHRLRSGSWESRLYGARSEARSRPQLPSGAILVALGLGKPSEVRAFGCCGFGPPYAMLPVQAQSRLPPTRRPSVC